MHADLIRSHSRDATVKQWWCYRIMLIIQFCSPEKEGFSNFQRWLQWQDFVSAEQQGLHLAGKGVFVPSHHLECRWSHWPVAWSCSAEVCSYCRKPFVDLLPVQSAVTFSGTPALNISVATVALRLWFVYLVSRSHSLLITDIMFFKVYDTNWTILVPTFGCVITHFGLRLHVRFFRVRWQLIKIGVQN